MKQHPISHIRRSLVRGIVLILPFLVTIWLFSLLFDVINLNITPLVREMFTYVGIPGLERWFARLGIPIIGLLLTLTFVYLVGLLGGNLAGKKLLSGVESWIRRIPIIRSVYGSARQLLDAFSETGQAHFSRVVLVEYPRLGMWTVGFVTREIVHHLPQNDRTTVHETVPVFLPTTPNPTSGWMILVPIQDIIELDLNVEDGLKLVVSGGIVSPDDLGAVIAKSTGPDRAQRS